MTWLKKLRKRWGYYFKTSYPQLEQIFALDTLFVRTKKPIMNKNKIIVIIILAVVAAGLIYLGSRFRAQIHGPSAAGAQPALQGRPLPQLSTAAQRVASYTPSGGDIKYRIVQKPVIGADAASGWDLYTSQEYGFSFIFPPADKILDNTESLGYQLPPSQAYKGSRDTFQIIMQGQNNSYFLLLMDDPDFSVASTTVTASSTATVNGLKMSKEILSSQETQYQSSQIIVYSFVKSGHSFVWYGTFEAKDFESINDFESMAESTTFK